MTPEQTDALAAWWRAALDDQRATLTPGGPGWADVQARLAIVRRYEAERENERMLRDEKNLSVAMLAMDRRYELGWVMQRLAHAHHLDHPERDGWVDSWRPE